MDVMFTGIVEEIGRIDSIQTAGNLRSFDIEAERVLEGLKPEDSMAVNGVCLTVTRRTQKGFSVDAVTETLSRTTLSLFSKGDHVNLERAMLLGGRLSGHFVQGHVDCIGNLDRVVKNRDQWMMTVAIPLSFCHAVVEKGSITVDGMSLTIASVHSPTFSLALIPYTLSHTIAAAYKAGRKVNVEIDILSKYVEQHLSGQGGTKGKGIDYYRSLGF